MAELPNRDALMVEIRRHTEAGKNRAAVAALLGISKNSVVGLIQRHAPDLVVAERKKGAARPPASPTPPKKKHFRFDPKGGDRMGGGIGNLIVRNAAALAAYVPPPAEPPTPTMVTLADLEPMQCKWPLDDGPVFHFCGAVSLEGKPYCAHHYARAYVPRVPPVAKPAAMEGE